VVDPTSPDEIAARVVELLTDPDKARAMGEAGRIRAQADWQWDDIAARCREYLADA
jgi:phosphatidyl-myo-inositol dimannoside synthase